MSSSINYLCAFSASTNQRFLRSTAWIVLKRFSSELFQVDPQRAEALSLINLYIFNTFFFYVLKLYMIFIYPVALSYGEIFIINSSA